MSVSSPATRRYLFDLYGGTCAYCLTRPADHLDHLVPRAAGGTNSRFNLVPACTPCGQSKGALSVTEWVARLAAGTPTTGTGAPPAPTYQVPMRPVAHLAACAPAPAHPAAHDSTHAAPARIGSDLP
ncbi:HNH endonuclease [Candidatus Frankia nodulisporulans]|uniref:HNH endonuclease n=1 Tax=Candidatus Frankia nodulisporulans TaxID=2060052 RepID=UPI0013D645BB|nr:HNH endonuclease [Candidatus Frankia nodulisporulans]